MIAIIANLIRTMALSIGTYNQYWLSVFAKIVILAFLAPIGLAFNAWHLYPANAIIGFIVLTMLVYILLRGEAIALVIASKMTGHDKLVTDTINNISKLTIWISLYFFLLSVVPIGRNFWLFPSLMLAIVILFLMDPFWGFKTELPKKLSYGYSAVMVLLLFMAMLPSAIYNKTIGFDPFAYLKMAKSDLILSDIEIELQAQADDEKATKLSKIYEKIKDGQDLTEKESKTIADELEDNKYNSVVNTTGRLIVTVGNKTVDALQVGLEKIETITTKAESSKGRSQLATKPITLGIGTYEVPLMAGETSEAWFQIAPAVEKIRTKASGDFVRIFQDGTMVQGGTDLRGKIFKIKAITDCPDLKITCS